MNRIKKVALFFRIVFQIIFIALPVLLIISWIYAPNELGFLIGIFRVDAIPDVYRDSILHPLTAAEKISGCLVSSIPMMIQLFVFYCLIKLFKLYEIGKIFSLYHVKYIRNIGYALLMGQLIQPFYQFVMGFVLTRNNPHHYRYAKVTFTQNNVGILLIALLIILISWIMAEGYKLQEEQQLTV